MKSSLDRSKRGGCDWRYALLCAKKLVVKVLTWLIHFMDPPFFERDWYQILKESNGIRSLKIFSKFSAINGFGLPLPTIIWVGLDILFPSAWWVVEDFILGLEANIFLYPCPLKVLQIQNESNGIRSLRIFSKSLAVNRFGLPLPTIIWVELAMLFPSAW